MGGSQSQFEGIQAVSIKVDKAVQIDTDIGEEIDDDIEREADNLISDCRNFVLQYKNKITQTNTKVSISGNHVSRQNNVSIQIGTEITETNTTITQINNTVVQTDNVDINIGENSFQLSNLEPLLQQLKSMFVERLSAWKQQLKRTDNPGKEEIIFKMYDDRNLPKYWRLSSEVSKLQENTAVPLNCIPKIVDVDSKTHEDIAALVMSTWDSTQLGYGRDAVWLLNYKNIEVVAVQRIENKNLFHSYDFERKRMRSIKGKCASLGKLEGSSGNVLTTQYLSTFMKEELFDDINECYLFHGTLSNNVEAIASNGLDPRVAKEMYGRAIYFTESSTKSDQYSGLWNRKTEKEIQTMLLVRVVLGETYLVKGDVIHHATGRSTFSDVTGCQLFKRPPCVNCSRTCCQCSNQRLYDSVVSNGDLQFKGFAIYDKNLCYPEYIIKYRRI